MGSLNIAPHAYVGCLIGRAAVYGTEVWRMSGKQLLGKLAELGVLTAYGRFAR